MSKEISPYFHQVQFLCDMVASYVNSLKGGATKEKCQIPVEIMLKFADEITEYVNDKQKGEEE